jgi:hypothetical protein
MNVIEGRYETMKTSFRRKIWLLLPSLILVSVLIALMPYSRTFAASVKISKSKVTLYKNGGRKKIHLYLYEDGEKVSAKWKSSKKSVATVSSSGYVKAKRKGTAKITATYHGKKYTCKVKVRGTSSTYKKCIKAYNTFLKNPYVTYTTKGATDQADNFCSMDLDGNGIVTAFDSQILAEARNGTRELTEEQWQQLGDLTVQDIINYIIGK